MSSASSEGRRRTTPSEQADLAREYAGGSTQSDLAKKHGISQVAVSKILRPWESLCAPPAGSS